ncbi:MAG: hypothetical protein IPJ88_06860 [Myxococcales bacterium]|nr:MAG: hypothetical protein IPJ88_06860 [Myxococcales bacterium]
MNQARGYLLLMFFFAVSACGRLGYDSVNTQSLLLDSDQDGVPDSEELFGDSDGDGLANFLDDDDDGDSLPTAFEVSEEAKAGGDVDGDGTVAYLDTDSDGDGILDSEELGDDLDGDGLPNFLDTDSDGDGIPDSDDADTFCADGRKDFSESDVDCGGAGCSGCADEKSCSVNTDCQSMECGSTGTCIATSCSDGQKEWG